MRLQFLLALSIFAVALQEVGSVQGQLGGVDGIMRRETQVKTKASAHDHGRTSSNIGKGSLAISSNAHVVRLLSSGNATTNGEDPADDSDATEKDDENAAAEDGDSNTPYDEAADEGTESWADVLHDFLPKDQKMPYHWVDKFKEGVTRPYPGSLYHLAHCAKQKDVRSCEEMLSETGCGWNRFYNTCEFCLGIVNEKMCNYTDMCQLTKTEGCQPLMNAHKEFHPVGACRNKGKNDNNLGYFIRWCVSITKAKSTHQECGRFCHSEYGSMYYSFNIDDDQCRCAAKSGPFWTDLAADNGLTFDEGTPNFVTYSIACAAA